MQILKDRPHVNGGEELTQIFKSHLEPPFNPAQPHVIDLRQDWIKLLKNRKIVEMVKVPGEANPADRFTNILGRVAFSKSESELMGRIGEDGRK